MNFPQESSSILEPHCLEVLPSFSLKDVVFHPPNMFVENGNPIFEKGSYLSFISFLGAFEMLISFGMCIQ